MSESGREPIATFRYYHRQGRAKAMPSSCEIRAKVRWQLRAGQRRHPPPQSRHRIGIHPQTHLRRSRPEAVSGRPRRLQIGPTKRVRRIRDSVSLACLPRADLRHERGDEAAQLPCGALGDRNCSARWRRRRRARGSFRHPGWKAGRTWPTSAQSRQTSCPRRPKVPELGRRCDPKLALFQPILDRARPKLERNRLAPATFGRTRANVSPISTDLARCGLVCGEIGPGVNPDPVVNRLPLGPFSF